MKILAGQKASQAMSSSECRTPPSTHKCLGEQVWFRSADEGTVEETPALG